MMKREAAPALSREQLQAQISRRLAQLSRKDRERLRAQELLIAEHLVTWAAVSDAMEVVRKELLGGDFELLQRYIHDVSEAVQAHREREQAGPLRREG